MLLIKKRVLFLIAFGIECKYLILSSLALINLSDAQTSFIEYLLVIVW